MKTLDEHIYEVNQDSDWYKKKDKQFDDINNFYRIIKEKYGFEEGFVFYHSEYFGIEYGTPDYEKFKDELLKNSNKDGIHIFKKKSKFNQIMKGLLDEVEEISPFKVHDTFGLNNTRGSQWVNGRWFFSIEDPENINQFGEISSVEFKDYLKVVMDALEKEEQK
jgi:hypothetical protein